MTRLRKSQGGRYPTASCIASSTNRYYLSGDIVKGAGDVLLAGSRPVGTATGPIPSSTVLGTDHLFACADDLKLVKETSETNDCRMATGSVTVSQ